MAIGFNDHSNDSDLVWTFYNSLPGHYCHLYYAILTAIILSSGKKLFLDFFFFSIFSILSLS